MVAGAVHLKREIGYNPTRFIQMVSEMGGTQAARQLLRGRNASDGFTTLWEHGRLALSVEAIVLLPWYQPLFTQDELETAERRLVDHGFDVVRFLEAARQRRPAWFEPGANPGGQP